jgi:hypothetical protein
LVAGFRLVGENALAGSGHHDRAGDWGNEFEQKHGTQGKQEKDKKDSDKIPEKGFNNPVVLEKRQTINPSSPSG